MCLFYRVWFIFSFILFIKCPSIHAQDGSVADSLKSYYIPGVHTDSNLLILSRISSFEANPDSIIKYSEILIEGASIDSNFDMMHEGYLNLGNAHKLKGDYNLALESFFKCLECVNKADLDEELARIYISIADVYSVNDNSENASIYYNRGIKLLREGTDSISLGTALLNAGDEYFNVEKYDSALILTKEAEVLFKLLQSELGQAYSIGNMGMNYAKLGSNVQAEINLNKAITMLEELEDFYPISIYKLYLADIDLEKGDVSSALNNALQSLDLAREYGLKDQLSEANLKLSQIYERKGNHSKSLDHFKEHISYRDSVKNIESVQNMAAQLTKYEVSQKQTEVDLLNQKSKNDSNIKKAMIIILILALILLSTLYWYYRSISREKLRSENLLLNILPAETAEELKEKGSVQAKRFESITVLFSDFQAFTEYSEHLDPEELVESVDFYFSKFDLIIEKYKLEKIKTIGDAYMCAGGLPFPSEDHAQRMVSAAIEINAFVKEVKRNNPDNKPRFDVRIGINTGPVVAGVVGLKKFAYDIWGDTVNVASRMESRSEVGKINISENTYEIIKDDFACEYRGEFEIKNRGTMKMYYIMT